MVDMLFQEGVQYCSANGDSQVLHLLQELRGDSKLITEYAYLGKAVVRLLENLEAGGSHLFIEVKRDGEVADLLATFQQLEYSRILCVSIFLGVRATELSRCFGFNVLAFGSLVHIGKKYLQAFALLGIKYWQFGRRFFCWLYVEGSSPLAKRFYLPTGLLFRLQN